MKRAPMVLVVLMLVMSISPSVAQITAPNNTDTVDGSRQTFSVDGYVSTKFASIGSEVMVHALTRGHSSSTIVTADILRYPGVDPISIITSVSLPADGIVIDTIALVNTGAHTDDADTMTWEGVYMIPVGSRGGVFGASITAQNGNMRVIDDPTQIRELFLSEFELVLKVIDDAWDTANPTMDIKGEFDSFEASVANNGGWTQFVQDATNGSGAGGSEQLWDAMLNAGYNQYNMSEGADFLVALMEFLDSDDIEASLSMIVGLMIYADEFPLPRAMDEFDEVVDYLMLFDPIENFTQFEGTSDFEAAYNALVGSDEWQDIRDALDDLANGTREFEAAQTIMHNIALLAVSAHPDAIGDALEAWVGPLAEGDIENMTPYQKLIVRWIGMADKLGETDVNCDGHPCEEGEIPNQIIWQYEKLMETAEGQAWKAKMESSSAYVNIAFGQFNTIPEDVLNIVFDSIQDPAWGTAGNITAEFGQWAENASGIERRMSWSPPEEGSSNEIVFEELYEVRTSDFDPHILDLGFELAYWGPDEATGYPADFSISMTNDHGGTVSTTLVQSVDDSRRYRGHMMANNIEDAVWTITQPMQGYAKPDDVDYAELKVESLRPSMLGSMILESLDEIFIVSALGVLVDQDEVTSNASAYPVGAVTYDASGPVEGAEVDVAIIRISPQRAIEAIAQFEPDGNAEITLGEGMIRGYYNGSDLVGDLSATISDFSNTGWNDHIHPQAAKLEDDVEISGTGGFWDGSSQIPAGRGLIEVTTMGNTDDGLEFEFIELALLPGSNGCARSEGNSGGSGVSIGWNHEHFMAEGAILKGGARPALQSVNIDWGDATELQEVSNGNESDGWQWHDYGVQEGNFSITVHYDDANGKVNHSMNYRINQGFYWEDDDEERMDGHYERGWCNLPAMRTSHTPSAEIIDGFITGGPLEVMTEEILQSDTQGRISMTVNPTLPGVYLTIVQSKVSLPGIGNSITGVGFNLVAATEGTLNIEGPTLTTHFAGFPVYTSEPDSGGLTTISVVSSNMPESEFKAELTISPVNLSDAFPTAPDGAFSNILDTSEGEEQKFELEFETGDTRRTQEVRIRAPISIVTITVIEDGALFPTAIHVGLLLNNPTALNMTGALGPGQTTNIRLDGENASRILVLAAPESGFDPASIDFSTITEAVYQGNAQGGVREEVGWIATEQKMQRVCENVDTWMEDRGYDWTTGEFDSNVQIAISHKPNNEYLPAAASFNTSNTVLSMSDGSLVEPTEEWKSEGENRKRASFKLDPSNESMYTLSTGTIYGSEIRFSLLEEEGKTTLDWHDGSQEICSDHVELTDSEVFDIIDDILSDLDSVAWGQGSSADLRLPILSSPIDDYTVIGVAQVGSGSDVTIIPAFGSQVATANPEPPSIQNLTVTFSPANPKPGDIVVVTALDEANQPVEGLSVVLLRGEELLFGQITDQNGQASFSIEAGTLMFRVTGGMYNTVSFVLLVTDIGTTTDGSVLPADSDNDGILDDEDAFPNDPDESVDTDGDGVGDNADAFPNDMNESADSDGDGIGDNADVEEETVESVVTLPMTSLLIAGAVLLVIGAAAVALLMMRNRGSDGPYHVEHDAPAEMWSDAGASSKRAVSTGAMASVGPPAGSPVSTGPPQNMSGELRDGYEVIEYPVGSSAWWWRDPETGQWTEWS